MRTSPSNVSLVLRLRTEPASHGEIVGHAEVVDTGEVVPVHGHDDLLALVCRVGAAGGAR
jgi:hypothetical protein